MSMIAHETGQHTVQPTEPVAGQLASSIWAIVPVKSLDRSKMRLSPVLAADRRASLMSGLLQHTLSAIVGSAAFGRIVVVSDDPVVWEVARRHGAQALDEGERGGLNDAVALAVDRAAEEGASSALVLPADLPFLQPPDLERMLCAMNEAAGEGSPEPPSMVICSDRSGEGTNALLLRLPTRFAFHYGAGSFQKHLQEAKRHGMEVRVVQVPTLQFDLDTVTDWEDYRKEFTSAAPTLAVPSPFVFPVEE